MQELQRVPEVVLDRIRAVAGRCRSQEAMPGVVHTRTWIVRCRDQVVVAKQVGRREGLFYDRIASVLCRHGVQAPRLLASTRVSGSRWVVLEYVPEPFPWDELSAEPIDVLCRLHAIPLDELTPHATELYRPAWTEELTARVLSALGGDMPSAERSLDAARTEAAALFEPACPISGDPNPTNWRRSGIIPVLVDWERIGLGAPAIDLAISVPGVGTDERYHAVASRYLGPNTIGSEVSALAHAMQIAKIWTIVDFTGELLRVVNSFEIFGKPVAPALRADLAFALEAVRKRAP
jgi:aminoglycoside phosphotransferase (APT) family kinase protein